MILLEFTNKVVNDVLIQRIEAEKPNIIETKCADFDRAMFHVWTAFNNANVVNISLSAPAAQSLLKNGGMDQLREAYGSNLVSAENGYDVTLQYEINANFNPIAIEKISKLKTILFSAPLVKACTDAENGTNLGSTFVDIPLRSSEERMWVRADSKDRVTAIFSVSFGDSDDSVIGRVFLQEFKKSIAGAPAVDYSATAPLELKGVSNLPRGDVGYLTFVLFDRHFKGAKKVQTAQLLSTFRNYLHYHLKCCKSYLHTRMRNRVDELLKVLNRAKQELPTEKKTATGRTFKRG